VSFNGKKEKVNNREKSSEATELIILKLILKAPNAFSKNILNLSTCTQLIWFQSFFHLDTITIINYKSSSESFPLFCCKSTSLTRSITKCHTWCNTKDCKRSFSESYT